MSQNFSVTDLPVYVVDDDPLVGETLRIVLQTRGFIVRLFQDPDEFLRAIDPSFPGCLVTDLRMPTVDGIELQRRLLAAESALSVIFISGNVSVSETVTIMSQGAVTLLEKPYRNDDLVAAVVKACELIAQNYWRNQQRKAALRKLSILTQEELAVMEYAAQGVTAKAICNKLEISPRTLDRRRQSALKKLEIHSVAEFVQLKLESER